jgi:hypothetical protein
MNEQRADLVPEIPSENEKAADKQKIADYGQ